VIAGLVLAAGSGSRLGQPKAPLVVNGERLVDRAVRVLREGGCDEIFVVLGAWQGEVDDCQIVINPDWETGMGSSLKAGLETILNNNRVTGVLVTLVDLVGVTPACVRAVMDEPGELVIATYDGQRGHPLKLDKSHLPAILAEIKGDLGARAYLRGRTDIVEIELSHIGDNRDIDTAEDLAARQQDPAADN